MVGFRPTGPAGAPRPQTPTRATTRWSSPAAVPSTGCCRSTLPPARSGTTPGAAVEEQVRRFGALAVDPQAREVHLDGVPVELTRTEFDLIDALSERPRLAFTRAQLIERVWGPGWIGDEHLVDIHLGHVRRKLDDDPTNPRYIRTVRGVGYRMGPG